jgi:rod shape determining protein RodA
LLDFFKFYIYGVNFILLVLTHLIAENIRGSARWLSLGPLNIQPSEIAKLTIIVTLAGFFASYKKEKIELKGLLLSLLLFIPLFAAVLWQPDLGTALTFVFIFSVMLFVRKFEFKYAFIAFLIFGLSSNIMWNSLHEYQQQRILVFINPNLDPLRAGYNVLQSKIAVGSGMFLGKGFGHGTQSKLRYLPEFHTDFMFASYSEEWGFVGVLVLLMFYSVLLVSVIKVVEKTKTLHESLICIGVFAMLLFQIFINVGMNLGIMPVTGIPLPLMSYGGSSMLLTFACLGMVNSIYNQRKYNYDF